MKKTEVCVLHGEFESELLFGSIYSKCKACESAEIEHSERKKQEEALFSRRMDFERLKGYNGIPERFKVARIDNFEALNEKMERIKSVCRDYVKKFDAVLEKGSSCFFVGPPGTGKTHMASAIGNALIEKQKTVAFCTVQKLIRMIKESWSKNALFTETSILDIYSKADLLILDEVGVQYGTEFEKNILFDVINARYENRKPSIFVSNLTKEDISGLLGDRVMDRLAEDGGKVIVFDWESFRRKKKV